MALFHGEKVKLFSLSSNRTLAQEVSEKLGLPLTACEVTKFADGETSVNTITETDFLTLKAKLTKPKILIEENFTVDFTYSGVTFKNKIANGKDDIYMQRTHIVLDLDVSSYNDSTSKASGDTYVYDEDEKTWSKETGEVNVALYNSYALGFETAFNISPTFDAFTYNEDTRLYTGSRTAGDDTYITKFMVKDGKFLSYEIVDEFKYEFSDYGTTTVTLPEVVA